MTPEYRDPDWVSYHVHKWLDWSSHLIGRPDVQAIEIGTHEGRSARAWCENVLTGDGARLLCVDPWHQNDSVYERAKLNLAGLPVEIRRTSSRWMLAECLLVGRVFDLAYIDGDHHAGTVLGDLCAVWHVLKPGGIAICDDYGWTSRRRPIGPQVGVDAWLDCHRDKILGYEIHSSQCCIWKPEAT